MKKPSFAGKRVGILIGCAIVCIIAITAGFVWHKGTSRVSSPMQQAYERLQDRSKRPPEVQIQEGKARFIQMDIATAGTDPTERAQNFLNEYIALYGLDSTTGTKLIPERAQRTSDFEQVVSFRQTYRDLPVFGGQVTVYLSDERVQSTIASLFLPTSTLSITPTLDSKQAIARAQQLVRSPQAKTYADPFLEIYDASVSDTGNATSSEAHLAWRVFLSAPKHTEIHLDAHTGALLASYSTSMESLDFDLQTANGNEATVENGCFWFISDDDQIGDEDGLERAYHADRDAVSAWWGGHHAYDFFRARFGMDSYDDDGEDLEAYIHAGGSVIAGAASYNAGCDIIQFSDGNVSDDLFVHEFTHAVIAHSSDLVYQNQPGALNEAFADIMASLQDGNWLIGESRTSGGEPFRDMSNPPRYGHPDTMPPQMITTDNGGVHTNSGILNKVAYLIADGGVHNQQQVEGIGRTKMGALMFNVMRSLPSNAQFNDARNRAISLADQWGRMRGNGYTQRDACMVRNAFFAAGFRAWDDSARADADCDGVEDGRDSDSDNDAIPDGRDNCPRTPNIDQLDADRDGRGNACDTDADNDGVADSIDNCPAVPNPDQTPGYGRPTPSIGRACQDFDNDGLLNPVDNCPLRANPDQTDTDRDGDGQVCDSDDDNDGITDYYESYGDNCPLVPNHDQADTDRDRIGNACDNCPAVANADQRDTDRDGQGDACDADRDNDGIPNTQDRCPETVACLADTLTGNREGYEISVGPTLRRTALPTSLCPSCTTDVPIVSFASSSCQGLAINDANPRDRFWLSDELGRASGHFTFVGGVFQARLDLSRGRTFFLNSQSGTRQTGTVPRSATLTTSDDACNEPRAPVAGRTTDTSTFGAAALSPSSPPSIPAPLPDTKTVEAEKNNPSLSDEQKKQEADRVTPNQKEDLKESLPSDEKRALDEKEQIPSPPPVQSVEKQPDEKVTPTEPEPATPQFSNIAPAITKLSQTPTTFVTYGVCSKTPTRLEVQFTPESMNELTSVQATYQTLSTDGVAISPSRNAQLLSFGENRLGFTLDTSLFAKNDLGTSDGKIRYKITLIDAASLQTTSEHSIDLISCTSFK